MNTLSQATNTNSTQPNSIDSQPNQNNLKINQQIPPQQNNQEQVDLTVKQYYPNQSNLKNPQIDQQITQQQNNYPNQGNSQEQFNLFKREQDQHQQQNQNLISDNEILKNQLQQQQIILNQFQNQQKDYENQISQLQEMINKYLNDLQKIKDQLGEKNGLINNLNQQIKTTQDLLIEHNNQILNLKQQLIEKDNKITQQNELIQHNEGLKDKIQTLFKNILQSDTEKQKEFNKIFEQKQNIKNLFQCCDNKIIFCKNKICMYHENCKLQQIQQYNPLNDDEQKFNCNCQQPLPILNIRKSKLQWQSALIFDKILSKQCETIMKSILAKNNQQMKKCSTPGCNFCWIIDQINGCGDVQYCLKCEHKGYSATKTKLNNQMIINEIQPDQSIPLPSYSNFELNTTPKVSKEAAIEHRKATKIGRPNNKGRICQCCGLQIEREEFSLRVGTDQLGFLGSGYPMYFDFIKSCLVIIAIQYISVGNFLLITHIDKLFQLSQTEESLKEKQDVLSLTAIYFTMIYIIYFRHNQIKLDSFCDLKQTSPGDYTVLLQGLPLTLARDDLEFKIKEEFENVIKVCFIYKQILKNQDNSRLFMEQLQDTYFEQDYFSGSALVSFKFKENKLQFLKKAKYNKFNYYLKQFLHLDLNSDGQINFIGLKLLVRQAPEPTDINWKYLNEWIEQSNYKKYLEILLNFLLLILLLYITCTTKQKVNKIFTLKSFFTPMITIVSYYIIPYLTKFINFRKYLSWTQTQKSLAYKMTILMSLFTIFISQFFNGEMFWLFICNSILPPLFLLMRPRQLQKNYKIQFGTLPQDQKELNQLYEYQNHNLTRNHAFINYTMIITNIYGTLMPINSIVAAIGLILYYWTDKYILLRHSTVQNQPSSTLSLEMYRLISFTPLMISCQHYINSSYDTLATIQLISTLVFYFIPQDLVIKKIWKTKKLKEFAPYDEAQFNFCYDRTNPALQDKATQNWVTQQKKAHQSKKIIHLLDEEQKDKLKKQLKKQLTKVQKLIGQMEAQLEQKQTTKLITQQDVSSSSQNKDHSDIVV